MRLRIATEVVRTRPTRRRDVVGVQQAAALERQAAAADAAREPPADRLERCDALVELAPPTRGKPLPVALRRLLVHRQCPERLADPLERDAGGLARLDERDPAQCHSRIAPLVAVGATGADQALSLVEPQRRLRDAASVGQLADRDLS